MRMAIVIVGAALALTACSKDSAKDVGENVEQGAEELAQGAKDVVTDPDVKEAGAALKEAAKDGGAAIKDVAVEMGDAARDAKARNDAEVPSEDKTTTN